ncbi:Transcription factor [Aspergillus sclerotialis]|uniref:Transcription factor n=1 Tax=Aspergillus sclerotialis TaxID=2070753 RepID=A0A3A2ZF81_9EURO|nr:Transcription factor [Aspergillus sclerotialis]
MATQPISSGSRPQFSNPWKPPSAKVSQALHDVPDGRIAHTLTACTRCRQVRPKHAVHRLSDKDILQGLWRQNHLADIISSGNPGATPESQDVAHANVEMPSVYTMILPETALFQEHI